MAEYDAEVSNDPLYVLRLSTAHVLAAAVTRLFPGAKRGWSTHRERLLLRLRSAQAALGGRFGPDRAEDGRDRRQRRAVRAGAVPQAEAAHRFEELGQPNKLYWVNQKAWGGELVSCGREAEAGEVSVRSRSGEQTPEALDAFLARLLAEIAERRLT